MIEQTMRNSDASTFEVSSSPRLFWQGRESGSPFPRNSENQAPYNPDSPYSASKRPSLENLKRASRVKNSNMLRERNQEYDPASVYVPQRPLATNRSPQKQPQSNSSPQQPQNRNDRQPGPRPPSPSKDQVSPAKSSLSRASRFGVKGTGFDPESEIWSDLDSVGNRYPKSVTFDAAPPQVNEYEMTTPDPSSIASESRDGSYDSEEDEGDVSFDRESSLDRDDSFDASLEDLEKTPVVLPDDWRYMSPSCANDELVKEDDPFTEDDESHSPGPTTPSQQNCLSSILVWSHWIRTESGVLFLPCLARVVNLSLLTLPLLEDWQQRSSWEVAVKEFFLLPPLLHHVQSRTSVN